jgi:hypothetical protein
LSSSHFPLYLTTPLFTLCTHFIPTSLHWQLTDSLTGYLNQCLNEIWLTLCSPICSALH